MLSGNKKAEKPKKKKKIKKITDESETGFNFSTNKHKHVFYLL